MKIGNNIPGFDISAKGLSIQRKKMNLIAENIANADTVRTADGQPYKRKYLTVVQKNDLFPALNLNSQNTIRLITTNENQISNPSTTLNVNGQNNDGIASYESVDNSKGEVVYDPNNVNANKDGYVQTSNVNIITEMVDMIAASRSYEANLTALNSSKQIVKDSLDI